MRRLYFLILSIMLANCTSKEKPILKIGLVADPQYADQPTKGKRHYAKSVQKLEEAIDTFNRDEVDFVQTLGDVIDTDWNSFDSILPIYDQLKPGIESYHVLGNHDYSIDSNYQKQVLERLNMPNFYYSYSQGGWRFLALDATDYAYYSKTAHQRDSTTINPYFDASKGKANHHDWNGAIGEEQIQWLIKELNYAKDQNQKVILFSHLPLKPLGDPHNLWNNEKIISVIENRPEVIAFINGHNHAGAYIHENGVHYITLFGMVDTAISSFGILNIYRDRIVLEGFGHQETLHIPLE